MQRASRLDACLPALGLAAACAGGGDPSPIVTEPVHHMEVANALAGADLRVAAPDYVRSFDDALDLGLSTADEYAAGEVFASNGLRHVRLQQVHAGLRVVGAEIVVHADDTTVLGFNGYVTGHLDGFEVAAGVSGDDALAAAMADHGGSEFSDQASELVILPGDDGLGARLVWQVSFYSPATASTEAGIWVTAVDAREGGVIERYNEMTTAVQQASGPGGNPKLRRTWSSELDVVPYAALFKMETDRLITVDRRSSDKVIMGSLDNLPDSVANDAHGFTEVTLDMMRVWMGRNSIDAKGFRLKSRVHDTRHCSGAPENACWDGKQMTYGDGGWTYPLGGALDVVAHEINHGFTKFHSNLKYKGQPGGLNESFSDIAGTVAEFYREGEAADFDIAEDVSKREPAARYMCTPSVDRGSIDDAGDFEKDMDPHFSSGPPNRAFCLAVGRFKASRDGSSTVEAVREIGHVWYTANAAYWTSRTDYQQGCRGTIDAARALGFGGEVVEALAASWADVGVVCQSSAAVCDGDDRCEAADGETCASCAEDCGACSQECSNWKKSKCKLGIGDCSKCDREPGCGDRVCDGDETDQTCAEDCGCAALECEAVAPFGCFCDPHCEEAGDCCSDVGTCN